VEGRELERSRAIENQALERADHESLRESGRTWNGPRVASTSWTDVARVDWIREPAGRVTARYCQPTAGEQGVTPSCDERVASEQPPHESDSYSLSGPPPFPCALTVCGQALSEQRSFHPVNDAGSARLVGQGDPRCVGAAQDAAVLAVHGRSGPGLAPFGLQVGPHDHAGL